MQTKPPSDTRKKHPLGITLSLSLSLSSPTFLSLCLLSPSLCFSVFPLSFLPQFLKEMLLLISEHSSSGSLTAAYEVNAASKPSASKPSASNPSGEIAPFSPVVTDLRRRDSRQRIHSPRVASTLIYLFQIYSTACLGHNCFINSLEN